MAVINPTHAFNLPSPYQAELSRIADQQRMAQMLQAQSQQPTERFSYKGIEAHTPATAGLAKILQSLSGAYFQKEARDQEKALGERYKTESSDILRQAFKAGAGTPAVDEIPQPPDEMGGGPGRVGSAAVAPNPQEMARLLMTSPNPTHEAFGLQQMQKNAQMQAFINSGNAGNAPSAAPVATTGGAMQTGGAPSAAPGNPPMAAAMSRFGGPAGGQPMAVWMQLDPTGGKYTEQLAKDFTDQNKPTDKIRELTAAGIKPGSDAWNFALTDTATQGGIWRRGADGGLSLVSGYAQGQAAVTSATKGAEAGFEIVEIPITQPDGTTILKRMTKAQAIQQLGGGATHQTVSPLRVTAQDVPAAVDLGRQLNEKGQSFNITVPAPGAQTSAPPGFGVSNPVQQEAQKAAATGSIKAITDKLESSFESAQMSEERMRQVQTLMPILDMPLISGPAATPQMFLSQVANKMYGVANEETLSNTRQLITGLAELSLSARGLIKGQGSITEGETALLTKARSAPESLTVPEYKRLFKLFEKQDRRAIEMHEVTRQRAKKAGIPNIDFWQVEAPSIKTGSGLTLSPAAQALVDKARGETQ